MAMVESQIAALELEKVVPKIRTLFERDDTFFSSIEKKNVIKVSNRAMKVPLELRPGGSFQYFNPDGGDLGRGGGPTIDNAQVNAVFMSENIEYTKLAEWATDDPRKAIVNGVRRLTASALDELRAMIDKQMQQAGDGVIGVVSAVATASGVDTYTFGTDGYGVRLMRFGQTVQVFDTTLATRRGSGLITAYDVASKTVSVTPAIAGAVAGDKIVTDGISAPLSLPALYGVKYHHSNASTGTWLGFSRSTTPEIRANRTNGGAVALTLPLPRLALNQIGNRVGSSNRVKPVAWMHPAQAQAYEEIGQALIMLNKSGGKNDGLDMYFGDEGMRLAGGVRIKTDFNWDMTRIDFIDADVWGRAEILPLGFYTTDGRKIFEIRGASGGVATSDIFYMVIGTQTFLTNPAAAAYIDNLAIPSGY